jgi:hypothetical protein
MSGNGRYQTQKSARTIALDSALLEAFKEYLSRHGHLADNKVSS